MIKVGALCQGKRIKGKHRVIQPVTNSQTFSQQQIEFHHNTPHSSHKNGAAERMIRSVRKILNSVVNLQLLTDEQLVTVMCECEKILNDRPLTYVSDDVNSLDVLTPSKLLLLRSNASLRPVSSKKMKTLLCAPGGNHSTSRIYFGLDL